MLKQLRKIAATRAAGVFLYGLIRFYSLTFRVRMENERQWVEELDRGGRVLICLWHQHFFIAVKFLAKYRKYNPCVMISRSLDGDIGARIVEAGGVSVARGSSSRGGKAALKEMIEMMRGRKLGAHILDGPRGPAGIVKGGAIAIAHGAGAAIVPTYVQPDRAWYFRSWDRFFIPKPFAKIKIYFYPKIILPPLKDKNDLEKQRKKLEDILRPHLWR
ncbi:MAG TPA: lysophospholipid acyltransferase family protein [Smithellaceae bacterium]|nr:lysophospholipid acyltransferase family protein [Smithellaceae bacterium]HRS89045.1 lysophospholipid acyltransferase family protein [Smithellaceae bacterium]HRV25083.1 lysophospholipid acyltransferase family protein [Smithellaceae bacterium]